MWELGYIGVRIIVKHAIFTLYINSIVAFYLSGFIGFETKVIQYQMTTGVCNVSISYFLHIVPSISAVC